MGDPVVFPEIVLSITPRLIRNIQRPEAGASEFRTGTETSFRVRPDSSPGPANPSVTSIAPMPNQGDRPSPMAPRENQPNALMNTGGGPAKNTGAATHASNTVQLHLQGPGQSRSGSTFAMQLAAQSDQPVTSLPVALSFDPRYLQVLNVEEGDFLKQGDVQASFASRVDPSGQIWISSSRPASSETMSAGILATINFRSVVPTDATRIQFLSTAAVGLDGKSLSVPTPSGHTLRIQP